jgi:hypothetical protein
LAEFLERRGHHVFQALGAFWANVKGPVYRCLPEDRETDFALQAIRQMMRQHNVRCARYLSAAGLGIPVGLYICDPREYGLGKLTYQFRRHVERGLEACKFRPAEREELLTAGLQCNLDTMERQHRFDSEFGDPARWKRFVDAARSTSGIEIIGAFVQGRLSGYAVTCEEDGCLHKLYKMTRTQDRGIPVSHTLDYSLITSAARNPEIHRVENANRSLVPASDEGLDSYKRHIGFTVEQCHLSVHFHPGIAPLLTNRPALAAGRAIWRFCPRNAQIGLAVKALEGARLTKDLARGQHVREN